jgi:holo-ACP synthase
LIQHDEVSNPAQQIHPRVMAQIHEPSCSPVSLDAMLERRDARAASQRRLLGRFGRAVVSLTLVNPGPVKDTVEARHIFEQGFAAIEQDLGRAGYAVLAREGAGFVTGPEALWVVDADALAVKRALVALEDRHPLGRLWDADVIAPDGRGLSRQQLDLPARRCLICDQPAHACARSGAHALAELQRAIKDKFDAYRNRTAA